MASICFFLPLLVNLILNAKLCSSRPVGNGLDSQNSPSYMKFFNKKVVNSIFLAPCDSEEIQSTIKSFQGDKASDISISVLKKCSPIISCHLAGYLNSFMESGIFPDILKIGKVSPVFKKGDPQLFDNIHTCYMKRSPPSRWSGLHHTHPVDGVTYVSTPNDRQLECLQPRC